MIDSAPIPTLPTLFKHASGQWAAKINGKLRYFGSWRKDPDGVVAQQRLADALPYFEAGKEPPKPRKRKRTAPTGPGEVRRPSRPSPKYKLVAHAGGSWMKGRKAVCSWRTHSADEADAEYERKCLPRAGGVFSKEELARLTVKFACDHFLTAFKSQVDKKDGEEGQRSISTYRQYKRACQVLRRVAGNDTLLVNLRPLDWKSVRDKIADGSALRDERKGGRKCETPSVFTVKKYLRGINQLLGYVTTVMAPGLILHTAAALRTPEKKEERRQQRKRPRNFFRREEIRQILDAADPVRKAWTLLGINCAFTNVDFAMLRKEHINFHQGTVTLPRRKTEIGRALPLWPETLDAIRAALDVRPQPRDAEHQDHIFLTGKGTLFLSGKYKESTTTITHEYNELLLSLGLKQKDIGPGSLRHTFRTMTKKAGYAEEARLVMRWVDDEELDVFYEQELDDEFEEADLELDRIRKCVFWLRDWVFAPKSRLRIAAS